MRGRGEGGGHARGRRGGNRSGTSGVVMEAKGMGMTSDIAVCRRRKARVLRQNGKVKAGIPKVAKRPLKVPNRTVQNILRKSKMQEKNNHENII